MGLFRKIIELSATVFENFIVLEFLGKIFEYKYPRFKKQIYFMIALLISTVFVTILNRLMLFEGWYILITAGLFIIYSLFCLNGKPSKKILMTIIAFTCIICINISMTYLFSLLFEGHYTEFMSSESPQRLLTLFITKFSFFLATRVILYIIKKDQVQLKKTELFLITISFILSNAIAIANFEIQIGKSELIFSLISTLSIIAINIFIFVMFKRISKENINKLKISILETQLLEQKAMIKDAGHLSQEIRKAEHDIKHHFVSILGDLEEDNADEAIRYIRHLLNDYETNIFKYILIDNSAVNSVLNFKISRCRENGIDIKIEVESSFSEFDNIDICVLIANLLDNAIEATIDANNPRIDLIIREEKNYLSILVRNSIKHPVLKSNKNLKTTKKDKRNHGFGLYSISQIVDKYDGLKKFYEKNGCFIADIWLKKKTCVLAERIKMESNC